MLLQNISEMQAEDYEDSAGVDRCANSAADRLKLSSDVRQPVHSSRGGEVHEPEVFMCPITQVRKSTSRIKESFLHPPNNLY